MDTKPELPHDDNKFRDCFLGHIKLIRDHLNLIIEQVEKDNKYSANWELKTDDNCHIFKTKIYGATGGHKAIINIDNSIYKNASTRPTFENLIIND